MKGLRIGLALLAFGALPAAADEFVNGYVRSDGTYVQPHYRSSPNSSPYDNYSAQGNSNPYTGQKGSVDSYNSTAPGVNNLSNSFGTTRRRY